jgi:hypothetical protein
MRRSSLLAVLLTLIGFVSLGVPANAQYDPEQGPDTFSMDEMVHAGHRFFGAASRGLGQLLERAFSRYGQPNGYILGEEGAAAIVAGARYGEGTLFTKNAGSRRVYWQGPSLGFDFGGNGARTMILVYDLPSVEYLYSRFPGINGSAYVVGGLGMTAMAKDYTVLVPITTGIGARLGVNVGYLKFTRGPTWNPF